MSLRQEEKPAEKSIDVRQYEAKGPEHSIYTALEQWVERDTAPGEVIATKYIEGNPAKGVRMTRPLCPYPQVPKYKGAGDTNDYRNFVCEAAPE